MNDCFVFPPALALALVFLSATIPGCGDDSHELPPSDTGPDVIADTGPDVIADTGGDDAAPSEPVVVDTGAEFIDGCQSFPGNCGGSAGADCGKCQYRIRYRADLCTPEAPCDDVMVYWSAYGCERPGIGNFFERLLESSPRLILVCMQPHYPGEMLPSSLGAPERETLLFDTVYGRLKSAGDLSAWSGANLLIGGCSIGATRYPVVAGRFVEDSAWVGDGKTAACLSDGVVDVAHQLAYVTAGTGTSCMGRVRRVTEAYAPGAFPDGCAGGDCMAFDSIMTPAGGTFAFSAGVEVADFAVPHWKLITEGRAFSDPATRCEQDVVEGKPLEALCAELDRGPGHQCVFESYPDEPHCSYYTAHFSELCIDWFRGL